MARETPAARRSPVAVTHLVHIGLLALEQQQREIALGSGGKHLVDGVFFHIVGIGVTLPRDFGGNGGLHACHVSASTTTSKSVETGLS